MRCIAIVVLAAQLPGALGLCILFPASHGAGARGRAGVLHRHAVRLHDEARAGSRGRGGLTQLAALSTGRKAELILKEVKSVDGVDVNIKLENLGGSRRRISGESGANDARRMHWSYRTRISARHDGRQRVLCLVEY